MRKMLLNYGVFQVGWFACVLGAAYGRPWMGPMVVSLAVGLHLAGAARPRREALLLALSALIGLVFDTLLLQTGWVDYPNGWWLPGAAPYWMVAMWVLFGTTLNLSMRWLHGRPWLAFTFGFIGGPLSYLAGERLGAMMLVQTGPALVALAIGWGLVLPLLFWLAAKLNGFTNGNRPEFIMSSWRKNEVQGHG